MKKIAFIGCGHSGSLFPLIKRFLADEYAVDYYYFHSGNRLCLEASDMMFESSKYGVEEVPTRCYPLLKSYFDSSLLHIYSFKTPRPFESYKLLYDLAMLTRYKYIKKFCRLINDRNYDFVNIIGRYNVLDIRMFCKLFKSKLAVSLHEVCNHDNPDFHHQNPLVKYLIRNKVDVIVYSKKSFDDIVMYEGIKMDKVKIIPFGKFETYKYMINRSGLNLPTRYILYIGYIKPYKGLDIFYHATSSLDDFGVKYVVAGAGESDCLALMNNDERYVVINKYLSVYEFADLIYNSEFIVCPYKSGSQSGIPMSSYVFNTPFVASDIPSFRDMIDDNENGMLFDVGDESALKSKLIEVSNNPEIISKFRHNLINFESLHPIFDWDNIFNQFKSTFSL